MVYLLSFFVLIIMFSMCSSVAFKICKDKLEAELWFAGLRALISSGQCGRSKIDGWSDGGLCLDVIYLPKTVL